MNCQAWSRSCSPPSLWCGGTSMLPGFPLRSSPCQSSWHQSESALTSALQFAWNVPEGEHSARRPHGWMLMQGSSRCGGVRGDRSAVKAGCAAWAKLSFHCSSPEYLFDAYSYSLLLAVVVSFYIEPGACVAVQICCQKPYRLHNLAFLCILFNSTVFSWPRLFSAHTYVLWACV